MNYEVRLKKLEAQMYRPEPVRLRVVYSAVVADIIGGWAGVVIWERGGGRTFHARQDDETITECLDRAHGKMQNMIRVQIRARRPTLADAGGISQVGSDGLAVVR